MQILERLVLTNLIPFFERSLLFFGRRHILRIIILKLISFSDLHLEELVLVIEVVNLAQDLIVLDRVIRLFHRVYKFEAVLQQLLFPEN